MPQRIFMDAAAQSTVSAAINNTQTTVTVASVSGFTAPTTPQQFSVVILDSGNPAFNASNPLATPFEYQQVNNITGNVLQFGPGGGAAARSAYAGTTPKSFFAGATIAATPLAEDFNASFPVKFDDQSPSGVSSITIPASGTIPQTFSTIRIKFKVRSTDASTGQDLLLIQISGNTGPNYDIQEMAGTGTTASTALVSNQTSGRIGVVPGGGTAAGLFNAGWCEIFAYTDTTTRKSWTAMSSRQDSVLGWESASGFFDNGTPAITTITVLLNSGNFAAGSRIVTELYP